MRSVPAAPSKSAQRMLQASETRRPQPPSRATSSRARGFGSTSRSRRNSRALKVSGNGMRWIREAMKEND